MTRNDEQRRSADQKQSAEQGNSPRSTSGAEIARWADVAMYTSKPIQAAEGPKVMLLSAPSDPLGLIAAQAKTYVGEFVDDLADITDDERRHYLGEIQKTALAMPLEAVLFNFSITGVTRSFTHQMVRQRTAAYAQESMRFSVVEDGFTDRVALPPSLLGGKPLAVWGVEAATTVNNSNRKFVTDNDRDRVVNHVRDELVEQYGTEADKARYEWERALLVTELAYKKLVNSGIPAEDARGLLPHNITTRIKYNTNMRALLEHIGLRTCTQAQFEWRGVAFQMMMALREYGKTQAYRVAMTEQEKFEFGSPFKPSAWQFDEIAKLFSPICYRAGKCTMKASFDRACSIRERVEANASFNRPSTKWHLPLYVAEVVGEGPDTYGPDAASELVAAISPSEWMLDPGAAR